MKTLEDGWHIVINASTFTIFEIWRYFLYYHNIACLHYPYI